MTDEAATETAAIPLLTIEMISRDRNGNVKEHIKIHPDGREEVLK